MTPTKIGILGTGDVGRALARGPDSFAGKLVIDATSPLASKLLEAREGHA